MAFFTCLKLAIERPCMSRISTFACLPPLMRSVRPSREMDIVFMIFAKTCVSSLLEEDFSLLRELEDLGSLFLLLLLLAWLLLDLFSVLVEDELALVEELLFALLLEELSVLIEEDEFVLDEEELLLISLLLDSVLVEEDDAASRALTVMLPVIVESSSTPVISMLKSYL